jgi:hypothetical protein
MRRLPRWLNAELGVFGIGIFAAAKMPYRREIVAKMGHPVVMVRSDVGHPANII